MPAFQGLRIALVGPLPPPAGGMANQTRQLAELLRGAGAEVELVQTNAAYRPAWAGRLPGLRALFRLLPYLLALWRAAGRNQLLHVMANSGWAWHLFAAPAIWAGYVRGRPVLVNYRGGEAEGFLESQAGLVGFTMKRAALLLVPSGFLQAVFGRFGHRAEILANVVNLQRFRPAGDADGPQLGAAAALEGPELLVARNLEALYDNATALRAFARLRQQHPGARLTVAGTGPEAEALRALAEQLGLAEAVRFAGRLDPEQMAAAYRRCRASINPSLADNSPNSVLESLASGVPVVSTDVGGVPYLVRDGETALLVPPRDPEAMAAALLRLLAEPELHARLRSAGLAHVQGYTWARIGPQLAAHYRRLLLPAAQRPALPIEPSGD